MRTGLDRRFASTSYYQTRPPTKYAIRAYLLGETAALFGRDLDKLTRAELVSLVIESA